MTIIEMQEVIKDAVEKEHRLDERCITSREWAEILAYLNDCFELMDEYIKECDKHISGGNNDV